MLRQPVSRLLQQQRRVCLARTYSDAAKPSESSSKGKEPQYTLSCCPADTVLPGLNYFKGQPPVMAKEDNEYPAWLWDLAKEREIPKDGPGGRGEKMLMRRENKKRIREQNFMKTQ